MDEATGVLGAKAAVGLDALNLYDSAGAGIVRELGRLASPFARIHLLRSRKGLRLLGQPVEQTYFCGASHVALAHAVERQDARAGCGDVFAGRDVAPGSRPHDLALAVPYAGGPAEDGRRAA